MIAEMKALARANDMCVLATVSGGKPHCSLMAYVTDADCEVIYMITHRSTRKYANLLANPNVSLLIDTRETTPRPRARAMTIEGVCAPIADPVIRDDVNRRMIAAHPHMADFAADRDAEVIAVRITAILLLDGLRREYYERLK